MSETILHRACAYARRHQTRPQAVAFGPSSQFIIFAFTKVPNAASSKNGGSGFLFEHHKRVLKAAVGGGHRRPPHCRKGSEKGVERSRSESGHS
jgi:hypothetical protein